MTSDSFFIFLNKSVGQTSQQCLTQFKRKFGFKKIGHHGTLDPFASGLLLVGVGEATKFFQFVDDSKKTYEATLMLGVKTDTLDHTGKTVSSEAVPDLCLEEIKAALHFFLGKIKQTPPMYSAIKIDGKKMYDLARQGIEVDRKVREVEIFDLELLDWQTPLLRIRATVSRGTYIRVLAEQIAEKLGTLAHLVSLVRTNLTGVSLESAFQIDGDPQQRLDRQIPILEMLGHLPKLWVSESQKHDLICGKKILLSEVISNSECIQETVVAVVSASEEFVGVCQFNDGKLVVERLMSF